MNYYKKQSNDPKEIRSKFNTVCNETGQPILKGEKCIYYPSDKTFYSLKSKQAYEFLNYMDDLLNGFNY